MSRRTNPGNRGQAQRKIAQDQLLTALLQHPTVKGAADAVGIDERTARRYLSDPAFRSAYERAKDAIDEEIRNGLVSLASKAMEGLNTLIDDSECPHATKAKVYLSLVERRVPMPSAAQQPPLQGQGVQLFDPHMTQYATQEELDAMEQLAKVWTERMAEAQSKKEQQA